MGCSPDSGELPLFFLFAGGMLACDLASTLPR